MVPPKLLSPAPTHTETPTFLQSLCSCGTDDSFAQTPQSQPLFFWVHFNPADNKFHLETLQEPEESALLLSPVRGYGDERLKDEGTKSCFAFPLSLGIVKCETG